MPLRAAPLAASQSLALQAQLKPRPATHPIHAASREAGETGGSCGGRTQSQPSCSPHGTPSTGFEVFQVQRSKPGTDTILLGRAPGKRPGLTWYQVDRQPGTQDKYGLQREAAPQEARVEGGAEQLGDAFPIPCTPQVAAAAGWVGGHGNAATQAKCAHQCRHRLPGSMQRLWPCCAVLCARSQAAPHADPRAGLAWETPCVARRTRPQRPSGPKRSPHAPPAYCRTCPQHTSSPRNSRHAPLAHCTRWLAGWPAGHPPSAKMALLQA
jgi:hypothetical protein